MSKSIVSNLSKSIASIDFLLFSLKTFNENYDLLSTRDKNSVKNSFRTDLINMHTNLTNILDLKQCEEIKKPRNNKPKNNKSKTTNLETTNQPELTNLETTNQPELTNLEATNQPELTKNKRAKQNNKK